MHHERGVAILTGCVEALLTAFEQGQQLDADAVRGICDAQQASTSGAIIGIRSLRSKTYPAGDARAEAGFIEM